MFTNLHLRFLLINHQVFLLNYIDSNLIGIVSRNCGKVISDFAILYCHGSPVISLLLVFVINGPGQNTIVPGRLLYQTIMI